MTDNIAEKLKIDIVIPVYNEKDNIEKNLNALNDNLRSVEADFIITIVYDFEEDNTLPVIKEIKENYSVPVNLKKNPERGVLSAIKHGIFSSECDYVLLSMADLSDDYSKIGDMTGHARNGSDVVCASRYMKGGKLHGGPFIKQLMSRLSGVSLHFFTGIPTHDITNSFKLYKVDTVKQFEIESKGGFEIGMEICTKAFVNGYKVSEVPANWWDRTEGESKFQLVKWLPKYLKWYFYLLKYVFGRL